MKHFFNILKLDIERRLKEYKERQRYKKLKRQEWAMLYLFMHQWDTKDKNARKMYFDVLDELKTFKNKPYYSDKL